MKRVLLGLGSNAPYNGMRPPEILKAACRELETLLAEPVFSSVYRTRPMYVTNQDDFLNMAATGLVADNASPFAFLDELHRIEAMFGRDRSKEIRFGPRPLDIDIELFGNETVSAPNLEIPHPRLEERAFVLIPALEILTNPADVLIREKYSVSLEKLRARALADGVEKAVENGSDRKDGRRKD